MRIAVMGAGAVGGYFGGLLARAGNPVILIARGPHLAAMRARGLMVKSHWGTFTVKVEATEDTRVVGPVDLILYTVKTYQNEGALPALVPLMTPATCVISLQNGVDSHETVASALGKEQVLAGAAYIEATLEAPGTVAQSGDVARLVFGEIHGPSSQRCHRILQTLVAAGVAAEVSDDMSMELWNKFLFISVLAGVTSAARARLSYLIPHTPVRDMILAAMKEGEAVARARGINLNPETVSRTMDYLVGWAKDLKASMHTDLEAGRPLELEALTGALVRLGHEVGVATPVNDLLYTLLLVHRDGAIATR